MKACGLAAMLVIGAASVAQAQGVAQPYQSPSYRAPTASSSSYGSPSGSVGVVQGARPLQPGSSSAQSYGGGVERTTVNPSSEYGTPIPGVTSPR